MTLAETPEMADWLRSGNKGIVELLVSYNTKSVCKLAVLMTEAGQDRSPLFKEVVAMCRQKREKRARRRD